MTCNKVGALVVIAICLCAGNSNLRATTYDTTPSWDGVDNIDAFGQPNTSTYGQTFIAPADSRLDDFTFYLQGGESVHLSMKAYVFSWSGSMLGGGGGQATGSPLYASPASILLDGNSTFQPVTVNTGGTFLTPGEQYVAFLTISNPDDYDVSIGTAVWGDIRSGHVPNNGGGGFVFFNNGSDFGALNTEVWDNFEDFGDLAWTAHFGAVPEPSSFALAALGLTGLAVFHLRHRAIQRGRHAGHAAGSISTVQA